MINQYAWVGIVVGVFVAGIGIGYVVFQANTSPNFMPMSSQQMQQMMNDPKTMNQWMGYMMNDSQLRQQMYSQMMQHNQFMQGMMSNQQFQQNWMGPWMMQNNATWGKMMGGPMMGNYP